MIHIQNIDDNECFKWCLVRYLHLPDHNPGRIAKAGKDFVKTQGFKNKISTVKTFTKLKKRILYSLVSLVMKTKKKNAIYVSKK